MALVALAVGCTSSDGFEAATVAPTPPEALTPPDTADELLFVVRSAHGRVVLDGTGSGTLTMSDVDDVTWFSDRPARDAGVSTPRDALRSFGWRSDGDALDDDAPNATLTASELDDALVLELLGASLDGGITFEVRSISGAAVTDTDLSNPDLFIDDSTADTSAGTPDGDIGTATELPDPTTVAAAAGFATRATLDDHVTRLFAAVGAGPESASDLTVRISVRASFPLGGSGERSTLPVLFAPASPVIGAPPEIAARIEKWLVDEGARVDTFEFDLTIRSDASPTPILIVQDVELPLSDVDRTPR